MVGGGVLGGIIIGLLILRSVLSKLKKKEVERRGYTDAEMKGMDSVDADDLG